MQKDHRFLAWLATGISLLVMASLACNLPLLQRSAGASNPSQAGQAAPTRAEAAPVKPAQEAAAGTARSNPYAADQSIVFGGWEVKVLEKYRGEEAWQIIQKDAPQSPPAPAGWEYYLAKIFIRCLSLDDQVHYLDVSQMFVTGDDLFAHPDILPYVPAPEFFYKDLITAESMAGWVDALIPTTEKNLELAFSPGSVGSPQQTVFLALDEGASIPVLQDLGAIKPNDLGVNSQEPAPFGQKVVTSKWEMTLLESVSGEQAWEMLQADNPNSQPPEEGMQYILVKAHIRDISSSEGAARLYSENFNTLDKNGEPNDYPKAYLRKIGDQAAVPYGWFPGSQGDAWFTVNAVKDINPVVLQYYDSGEYRYFALTP
jgi:hypothetical protein